MGAVFKSNSIRFFAITLLALVISSQLFASYTDIHYSRGVELYNKGLYDAAEKEFRQYISLNPNDKGLMRANSEGYLTLISIVSNSGNLESVYLNTERFWSITPLISEIRAKFSYFLIDNQRFPEAVQLLGKMDPKDLTPDLRNEYNFKYGYAQFMSGNMNSALSLFKSVFEAAPGQYTNPSYYYTAYIHYLRKEFSTALPLFEITTNDHRFELLSRYYILESRFMLKDWSYVTRNGEQLYSQLQGELKTKTARIVSEAFFATDNTDKAKYYFERYSLESENLSRKDIYYAGILSYTQSRYNDAIELFRQVINGNDSITQNAAYHMGRCYIEIKNKIEALNSFILASQSDYDITIKEDAKFNAAKLSFDLNGDISMFRNYLDTYSPSENKFNEIQSYIANSYLVNQNYKSAIEALRTIRNPSSTDVVNLQKATFLRGMQLLNLGAYRDAIPVFELSLTNGAYNNNLYNVTRFWLAEAYYRNNQFKRSIDINLELASRNTSFRGNQEYPTSFYNLAYGYFKLGDYSQSEHWFARYLNLPHGSILYAEEAKTRLGDSYFMQRKYTQAIEAYNSVTGQNRNLRHYALYQTAIARGLLGQESTKAQILKDLLTPQLEKTLYPEVLYELGRTLIQTGNNTEAVKYLTQLSEEYINSPFYPKALLELGLISLNRGENSKAISYYKTILEKAPQSPEAQSAIAGLENIYQEMGQPSQFLSYIDDLGLSESRTASERELILFSSAEKLFLSANYAGAINSLNSFLKSYPDGSKVAQAYFYLGESYDKIGKPELALDAFLKVMEIGEGSFTELATLNYARISFRLQNYRQAANAYSSLTRIAQLENNKLESQIGLVRSYYMDRQFRNAIAEAGKAEQLPLSEKDQLNLKYIIAKSFFSLGERDNAMPYLKELSKNKITPEGAESTYLIISDAFDKGDFPKVEKEVFAFADSRTPQSYWLAKSYILLGDTYAERGNWEQAKATYQSIQESYRPAQKDDIEEQIKMRLSRIDEKNEN